MVRYFNGDILNSGANIICHQVNCRGVMGAGLAKQIKDKYPMAYRDYVIACSEKTVYGLLGTVRYTLVGTQQWIAHLFAQKNFGTGHRQTDYDALRDCLYAISKEQNSTKFRVAIPSGIGCGLAGGDWEVVHGIIKKVFCSGYADCEVWTLT